MSKIGWTCHETIGIGIANLRPLYYPLIQLYKDLLRCNDAVVEESLPGEFSIKALINQSYSYGYCHTYYLAPGKKVKMA